MNMRKPLRTLVNAAVISILSAGAVHAAGFSLYGEGAGYTAGNYAAGSAAEAADASTGWYNPAGLSLIHNKQGVFGGTGVFPNFRLNGTSTYATTNPLSPDTTILYQQKLKDTDGSYNGFVPMGHIAVPVGERTTVGLSITAPYGLSTDWSPSSPVRYSATYTELLTANVSPEIGSRVSDHFAVGAGMDFQYSRVKFNQMIGVPTLLEVFGNDPRGVDTFSFNKGASWGLGFHAGVMALFNEDHTRIGLNYQSRVRHTFYGHSILKGPLASSTVNPNVFNPTALEPGKWTNYDLFSNPIEFPDVLTLSGYQDVNNHLALLGSVVYTGWGVFKNIQLNNVAAPNVSVEPETAGDISRANIINSVAQNFTDAWRVALGANYRFNEQWMVRVGGGYDQSPTNNRDRNIRLPDADRWAVAVGAHYQMKPNLGFDLGYTHLFSGSKPSINSTQILPPISSYNVNSPNGVVNADLVGGQVVWVIDQMPAAPMK